MIPKCLLPTVVALHVTVSFVFATELPVDNGSFEKPVVRNPNKQAWKNGPALGWSSDSVDPKSQFVQVAANSNPAQSNAEGRQFGGIKSGVVWYQDLGIKFQPNTTYTINMAASHRTGRHNHEMSRLEFGLFTSAKHAVDLGEAGFIDIKGFKSESGNPDADDQFNRFRYADELSKVGSGALANVYTFTTGDQPPKGNVVIFIRNAGEGRAEFDNVTLNASKKVAIPEPALYSMLAGLLALVACAVHRRR